MIELAGSHTPWLILIALQYFFLGMMFGDKKKWKLYLVVSIHFGLLALIASGLRMYIVLHR